MAEGDGEGQGHSHLAVVADKVENTSTKITPQQELILNGFELGERVRAEKAAGITGASQMKDYIRTLEGDGTREIMDVLTNKDIAEKLRTDKPIRDADLSILFHFPSRFAVTNSGILTLTTINRNKPGEIRPGEQFLSLEEANNSLALEIRDAEQNKVYVLKRDDINKRFMVTQIKDELS